MPEPWHQTRRVLLRAHPGVPEVEGFAVGWPVVERKAVAPHAVETVWDAGPIVHFHCVDDALTGNSYIYVTGPIWTFADGVVDAAEDKLDTWRLDDLLHLVDTTPETEERGRAVIKMAYAAPPLVDMRVVQRIEDAIASKVPVLRDMAVWSTSIYACPHLLPTLRRVAKSEPNEDIRARARALLLLYAKRGITP
jgi:hypothetical protein